MLRAMLIAMGCLSMGLAAASTAGAQDGSALEELTSSYRHGGAVSSTLAPSIALRRAVPADCVVTSSVRLDRDLDCSLDVSGDGIVVDLDGHTVGGVFLRDGDRLTVRDGTIVGPMSFEGAADNVLSGVTVRGVGGFAVTLGCGDLILNSRFVDNGVGLDQFFGCGAEVRNSTFVGNDIGINIANNSGDLVNGNHFEGNGIGVRLFDEDEIGANRATIKRNTFERNDVGVYLEARSEAFGNRIVRNQFLRNTTAGIFVELACWDDQGCASGTRIDDNRAIGNGRDPGELIVVDPDSGTAVSFRPDDGITVVGAPGFLDRITVARNVTVLNADLGIDAEGVTDGRGNRGRRNGDPVQCVGVVCRP